LRPWAWLGEPGGDEGEGEQNDRQGEQSYVSHLIDDKDWQIRLMRPDGSGARTIFRCSTPCHGGGYWLTWSPDGKQVAFVEYIKQPDNTYRPRLAVVNADGHNYHLLDTAGLSACCASWTALRKP
jgi:Tol biopolymer transport system component